MNAKKKILAAVSALTMFWSVAANAANPNMYTATTMFWGALGQIDSECTLYWGYDPAPNSNYAGCVSAGKLSWANTYYIGASLTDEYQLDGDGYSVRDTYIAAGDLLYYA